MKLNAQKISSMFASRQADTNDFNNGAIHRSELKDLWKHMDKTLLTEDCDMIALPESVKPTRWGIDIRPGCVDIQRHDRSIQEHTDDTNAGQYFQLVVVKNSKHTGRYVTEAVISYYDPSGKKRESEMREGKSIVFNPRRPHSVIYYGQTYTVAMRTVIKNRKK